jgi:hypothetical protein
MNRADSFKVPSQGSAERVWQHHASILLTLASTRRDFASVEVHVLHAQLETFLQAKAGSVEQ